MVCVQPYLAGEVLANQSRQLPAADGGGSPGYNRSMTTHYALSVKQPWAALLVHGLKTIEVRRWPTARRGRILIHAARVPDERPEAWTHVPQEWLEAAQLLGGIVGAGDLLDCRCYRTIAEFQVDQSRHFNDPSWFQAPLHGFVFANLTPLPFRRYPGWMRFFPVKDAEAGDA
jgi:hypothetical protein